MSEHKMKQSLAAITVKDEGPLKGFQSTEARDRALVPPPSEDENTEPESAEVEVRVSVAEVQKTDGNDANKPVRVRSRQYIAPFRFGKKMYTLPANKEVVIPRAVKLHLEEKGLI